MALTMEPFLRSLLLSVYRHKLGELLKRTRIEIHPEKGRSMMGTADETGTLEYGEVFVQYSTKLNEPNVERQVLFFYLLVSPVLFTTKLSLLVLG